MFAGLAGSLRAEHVPSLLQFAPDVLGFRGGLCRRGDRNATLDPDAVRGVRRAVPFCDSRVPLGRCYGAPESGRRGMSGKQTISGRREVSDRIFVRGLVLPIAIGVYDEEQGITQKVRFTIEASVGGGVSPKGDHIDEVPSYDDLVGAVKSIVAAGHINLVETLAARIAERCLRWTSASSRCWCASKSSSAAPKPWASKSSARARRERVQPANGHQARRQPFRERPHRLHFEGRR